MGLVGLSSPGAMTPTQVGPGAPQLEPQGAVLLGKPDKKPGVGQGNWPCSVQNWLYRVRADCPFARAPDYPTSHPSQSAQSQAALR